MKPSLSAAWLGLLCAVSDAVTITLDGPDVLIRVVVSDDATSNRTYISELYTKRSGTVASSNVLFNFTQVSGGYSDSWSTSRLSSTAISWTQGSTTQWAGSTGGLIEYVSSTALTLTGIDVGPALETWTLDVTSGFAWGVDRTYTSDIAAVCDRGPTLDISTEFNLSAPAGSQIPSLLDPALTWSPTSGCGFSCDFGSGQDSSWVSAASPSTSSSILLSPSMLTFATTLACAGSGAAGGCGIAYAWPGAWASSGLALSVVPLAPGGGPGARPVPANTSLAFSWLWTPSPSNAAPIESEACPQGLVPFVFSHPDAAVQRGMCQVAAAFNMWAGNIQGNSPGSVICLHEMSLFPLNQGIYAGLAGHAAMQQQLELFARFAVRDDGFVYPRFQYNAYTPMPIHDQIGHFLTAYYWHAVNTGNATFIASVWPVLLRVVAYIDSTMLFSTDGIATTPPPASGLPNANVAGNWFDIVDFGGRDAIVNAYICQALNATAQLAAWIGDAGNATRLAAMHAACVETYNAVFWNETLGLYGDWVDTAGSARFYGYIWQQGLVTDPLAGIANETRAGIMARAVQARLGAILTEFNKTAEQAWCAPTNLWSVLPQDSFSNGTMQDQKDFGNYENGACFILIHGMYEALLDHAGLPSAVYGALNATLASSASTLLWGQHYDWRYSESFEGFDVLTDTLYVLRAGLHGTFGLRQYLGSLVVVSGGAAAEMEGASWVFMHMGSPVRATVSNGTSVIEYLE